MVIDNLPNNNRLIGNVPGAPTPEDPTNAEPIVLQQPVLTCTPDPTMAECHRQVIGVDSAGGKAYRKATGFYNLHRKNSE
jgi:hypothetical protein